MNKNKRNIRAKQKAALLEQRRNERRELLKRTQKYITIPAPEGQGFDKAKEVRFTNPAWQYLKHGFKPYLELPKNKKK